MSSLDTKVPPPAVAFLMAALMWGVARFTPRLAMPDALRLGTALAVLLVAVGISVAGILSFRRARTTVNPTKPGNASSLVRSGIYRVTRNPMYVGLTIALFAWSVYLASPFALAGPLGFVLYMNRFQIAPEERALEQLFRADYADYRARVRRWL